jgi:hypothetical protein
MTNRCDPTASDARELADSLRDDLLQDLLAVSMLIEGARTRVDGRKAPAAHGLLGEAGAAIRHDIETVSALISRLCAEGKRPTRTTRTARTASLAVQSW